MYPDVCRLVAVSNLFAVRDGSLDASSQVYDCCGVVIRSHPLWLGTRLANPLIKQGRNPMRNHKTSWSIPADIKQKWVDALRSGEYIKGKTYLYSHGCHCVMGVLCSVSGVDNEDMEWKHVTSQLVSIVPKFISAENLWFIHTDYTRKDLIRSYVADGGERRLTFLNDYECLTFRDMATLIEEHVTTTEEKDNQ